VLEVVLRELELADRQVELVVQAVEVTQALQVL
jgi:hypothetical protein